jgi:hypothetical protein
VVRIHQRAPLKLLIRSIQRTRFGGGSGGQWLPGRIRGAGPEQTDVAKLQVSRLPPSQEPISCSHRSPRTEQSHRAILAPECHSLGPSRGDKLPRCSGATVQGRSRRPRPGQIWIAGAALGALTRPFRSTASACSSFDATGTRARCPSSKASTPSPEDRHSESERDEIVPR